MSYEYKELIEQAIIDDDRPLDWEEGFKELDEVYAQAAKADEYEAKTKAWDKYKAHMESYIAGEVNEEELVSDLESDYFESGGYDAKKMTKWTTAPNAQLNLL